MIEFALRDEAKATDAITQLVNTARSEGDVPPQGAAGLAIAKTTQALGTLRHGQLLGQAPGEAGGR